MKGRKKMTVKGTYICIRENKDSETAFFITNKECTGGVELIAAKVKPNAPDFENATIYARLYMTDKEFIELAKAVEFEAEKAQKRSTPKKPFILNYNQPEPEAPKKRKSAGTKKSTAKKATTKKGKKK